MNYLKLHLLVILAMTSVAQAQVSADSLNAEVDADIDRMYSPPTIRSTQPTTVQTVIVSPRQSSQQSSVQKQPITVVEASPLSASNADSIRKNRQEEEMRTETRIVEKLELSRMEDEKKRAQVLFGDKFDALNNRENVAPHTDNVYPIVVPSSHVEAQPIIIQRNDSISRGDVAQEVRAALDEDKATSDESTGMFEKKYFSAQAGIPQYADMAAIQGNYSFGFGLGTSNDFLLVEGGFIYSNYRIANASYLYNAGSDNAPYYIGGYGNFIMNQYQTYLATKFQIMSGTIRPTLGGILAYSYRTYVTDSYTAMGAAGTKTGTSGAIDFGITAGVDIALTERFAIGADLKYMFNISSNINGDTQPGATSPEKLNYYLLGISAKMAF
ncbi:MAG: hypothetical protein H7Z71_06370 [Moraxellaceae bacterium]|nr:hypothetical protein [Pseudobdellovibrionaceae bacterium]